MLTPSFRHSISILVLLLTFSSIAQATSTQGQIIVCSEGSNIVLTVTTIPGRPTTTTESVSGKAHQPKVVTTRQGNYVHSEFTRHEIGFQSCAEVLADANILDQFGYYLDGCLDSTKTEIKMELDLNLADPRDSHLRFKIKRKTLDLVTKGFLRSYDKPYIRDAAVQCSVEELNE